MQNNLLSYRVDSFTTHFKSITVLADIVAYYNYFIGTVPALGPLLLSLDVRGNFLTDLPTASYTWCGCAGNCMAAATAAAKCISGGSGQRPAADCAPCGTTNAVGPFCTSGGVCTVDASARITAGTLNLPAQPALPMTCSLLMDPVDCASSSPRAPHPVLLTLCSSPRAPHPVLLTPCSSPRAPHPVLLTPCSSPRAPHPVLLTPCSSPRAPHPVLLTPCSSPRAPHPVLLTPCSSPRAPHPVLLTPCSSSRAPHPVLLTPCSSPRAPHPVLLTPCSSPRAPHPVLLTPCSSPRAPHPVLLTPCSSPRAPHPVLLTPCSSPRAPHPVLLTPCSSPHAPHPVLLTPCSSPRAPHPMLLTPCSSPRAHPLHPSTVPSTTLFAAMMNIKSALGVTYTTWTATNPCRYARSAVAVAGEWNGVTCVNGKVSDINLPGNLFNYRLDSFTTNLRSLPELALLHSTSVSHAATHLIATFTISAPLAVPCTTTTSLYAPAPSLPSPLASGARFNYLIGTVPALGPLLVLLDIQGNFITDVPAATYTYCGGYFNCLPTPSKCPSGGTTQRSAAACSVCGTTNGVGPFCASTGGVCSVDAAALVTAGTVNSPSQPVLPMSCVGGTPVMNAADFAAMQNIKTTLGVTYTTWTSTAPCRNARSAVALAGEWTGVTCTDTGKVSDIGIAGNYLMGSVPALATQLRTLDLRFNFLTDFPAVAYSSCGGAGNCLLTPSKCATLGTAQRAAAECAFCSTTNGVGPFCAATGGVCTLDAAARVTAGTVNAPAQAVLPMACVGGTTVAIKESTGQVSSGCVRAAAHLGMTAMCDGLVQCCCIIRALSCVGLCCSGRWAVCEGPCPPCGSSRAPWGVPPSPAAYIIAPYHPVPLTSPAMLALKSSLGVTLTTWAATVPCQLAGQTTTVAVWTGVLCDSTGSVVSITQTNSNLKGSLPTDISTLTALTFLRMMLVYCLVTHSCFPLNPPTGGSHAATCLIAALPISSCRSAAHYNYFGAVYNYFIGTVPAIASKLSTLDVRGNFVTDVPTGSYSWCGGAGNCLLTPAKCTSGGSAQRPAADCAICGTTNAVGPFCASTGGVCTLDAAARVTAGTVNAPAQPALPMACVGGTTVAIKESTGLPPPPTSRVPLTSPAMLALKSSLGVTLTTWAATVPCQLAGKTTTVAVWTGVLCDSTGSVVSITQTNSNLKGSLPTDISTLTALTFLRMMLVYCLVTHSCFPLNPPTGGSHAATCLIAALPISSCRSAAHYNYFGAVYNYFIGTVPAIASKLSTLDVRGNFVTDVPTGSYSWCGGAGNCLLTPAKCTSGGSAQRPAADCAICGTTNAVGPFCASTGGVCTLDAAARVTAGTVNAPAQPALPMACVGGTTVAIKESTGLPPPPTSRVPLTSPAMLALKSSLGVTLTTWAATVPCQLAGKTTTVAVWTGVLCDSTGSVVSITQTNSNLKGSLPTDISTLTALTFLRMMLVYCLVTHSCFPLNPPTGGSHAATCLIAALPISSCRSAAHYNYFGAVYNYFIGTVPAIASKLSTLDVRGNFVTDVPTGSYSWCGGAGNCLLTPAKCTSGGSAQRPAADCAICGTTNAVGPFCASTGGVCTLDAAARVTAGTVNAPAQPALPMACVGGTTVAIKESTGLPPPPTSRVPYTSPAMLALKSSLGVTLTTWAATVPCQLAGQTTTVAVWTGVLCDSTGSVVSINLAQNLFNTRLDSFTTNLQSLPVLANLSSLSSSFPPMLQRSALQLLVWRSPLVSRGPSETHCVVSLLCTSRLAALSPLTSGAVYNYLIGTVPALASGLRSLNVRGNFLTDVPAATYTYCGGDTNCLLTPSKCTTTGTTQRPPAACAICGTTNGVGPFCAAGGVCVADATAAVTAGTVNSNSQPVLPLACSAPPVLVKESAAMLALKLELGVSFTTWAATVPCQLAGQAATVKVWTGVLCDSTGRVVSINLPGNFFRDRLDSFTTSLRFLPLADIGAVYNYLIGTVPALASQLRSLDVRGNFLTDVPTANYTFCGCAGNCMLTPSKCISNGTAQRPAAQCAFCGTTNGVGPFCWGAGGECVADVIALWDVGILNSPSQPVQPRACMGGSVQAIAQSAAMLALKSSLGVTFNSWAASVPCSVWMVSPSVPTWPNVICDGEGNVIGM
ncbi:unnamed protein product [Closterium sp. NIES-65]|nr:unnamed protein product [Closterium sp. NIES-65]